MLKKSLFVDVIREVLEKEKQKKEEILSSEDAEKLLKIIDAEFDNFLNTIAGFSLRLAAIKGKVEEGTEPYNDLTEVKNKLENLYEIAYKVRESVVDMLDKAFQKLTGASSTRRK